MNQGGAPLGNKNASKARPWRDAIDRALALRNKSRTDGKKALDELAEKLLLKCDELDISAIKELGDRIEGKSAQSVVISGDEDAPLVTRIERVIKNTQD